MMFEDEKVEFKEIFVPDIYKEVIAFANTDGGVILVGVNDNGEKVGLDDIDDTYTRITNGIRDAILPDVTMFIKYSLEKGKIIRIEIGEGAYKPYYLKSKGLKPSGVYVRQGASSAPASQDQIRQMIKYADGDVFEKLRSLNQELTFQYAAEVFEKNNLPFVEEKYYQLGIKSHELGLFTNLGLLLSDQCLHTVKVAVFADDENTVFKDKKEFSGSILKQLEETFQYLQLCNQNHAVISGLERKDHWDYKEATVREALLNSLIHRDYNYSGSIIININNQQMEFISIGGLLAGISKEDIRNGISLSRNSKLAEIFHRLRFIESYGTGIRRIYSLYKNCSKQPEISITPNSFKIILPNMNVVEDTVTTSNSSLSATEQPPLNVTQQMQNILDYISEYGEISIKDVQKLLDIKNTRAYVIMKKLTDAGLIQKNGRGKNQTYQLL
ncbi:MAG: putative DNA binding domain-containing protein [Hespellia sp.]|nr:putative DNA binding domain-containing protein [Hespellia sp.]